jgi:predicted DCC family thiol-disulfide oxidoreductase YuxK
MNPMGGEPVILFDGTCGLCDRWVSFVIASDRRRRFRFAPLQSDVGRSLLRAHDLPIDTLDSFALVSSGQAFQRSTAALQVLRRLGLPWSLLWVGVIVPRLVRDRLYDYVAAHRYRWFGQAEACTLPAPEERDRFLHL